MGCIRDVNFFRADAGRFLRHERHDEMRALRRDERYAEQFGLNGAPPPVGLWGGLPQAGGCLGREIRHEERRDARLEALGLGGVNPFQPTGLGCIG